MRIIQSFWSVPLLKDNDNFIISKMSGGWLTAKHHWYSWVLSCNQLLQFYPSVELYTDEHGYNILINTLELPYTKVYKSLDKCSVYKPSMWSIGKIYSYSLQTTPFIHVDSDLFIWKSFGNSLQLYPIITLHREMNNWHEYAPSLREILKYGNNVPQELINLSDRRTFNMGIFGGNNITFIHDYCKLVLDFINSNIDNDSIKDWSPLNMVFEQLLLSQLAIKERIKIGCLLKNVRYDSYAHADFFGVPLLQKYLHLLGPLKKKPKFCNQLEKKVRRRYPKYYQIIQELPL